MSTFTVSADWGVIPLEVTFTDTTAGATNTNWVFGDGTVGGGVTTTHIYDAAGEFEVIMTNSEGSATDTITVVAPYTITFGPNTLSIPLRQVDDADFAGIALRGLNSTYPNVWYDNGNYPLRTISLWPIPQQSWAIELWCWEPIGQSTDLDAPLNLPPGYERYLRFKLAVEIAAEFGKEVPPLVLKNLQEAEATIKRMNTQTPLANPSSLAVASSAGNIPGSVDWVGMRGGLWALPNWRG